MLGRYPRVSQSEFRLKGAADSWALDYLGGYFEAIGAIGQARMDHGAGRVLQRAKMARGEANDYQSKMH